jgi:hypothetical protein
MQAGERDSKPIECYLYLLVQILTRRAAGGSEMKIVWQKGHSPGQDFRK